VLFRLQAGAQADARVEPQAVTRAQQRDRHIDVVTHDLTTRRDEIAGALPRIATHRRVKAVEHRTHADTALVPEAEAAIPPAEPTGLARREFRDTRASPDRVDVGAVERGPQPVDPIARDERVGVDSRDHVAARGIEAGGTRVRDAGVLLRDHAHAREA